MVFLFYFLHIGYFPELGLDDALLLFPASIIVAALFVVFLLLYLFCPCFIWNAAISEIDYIKELPYDKKKKHMYLFLWIPSAIFVLSLHFLYFFPLFPFLNSFRLAVIVFILISVCYFVVLYCCRVEKIGKKRNKPFFSLLACLLFGEFFFFIGRIYFYRLISKGDSVHYSSMELSIISGLLLLSLVSSNFIVLFPPEKTNKILWKILIPIVI